MKRIRLDQTSLPHDEQKVIWQTEYDIHNSSFKTGTYDASRNVFNAGYVGNSSYLCSFDFARDVVCWQGIDQEKEMDNGSENKGFNFILDSENPNIINMKDSLESYSRKISIQEALILQQRLSEVILEAVSKK
jgi:hypothetical protein